MKNQKEGMSREQLKNAQLTQKEGTAAQLAMGLLSLVELPVSENEQFLKWCRDNGKKGIPVLAEKHSHMGYRQLNAILKSDIKQLLSKWLMDSWMQGLQAEDMQVSNRYINGWKTKFLQNKRVSLEGMLQILTNVTLKSEGLSMND